MNEICSVSNDGDDGYPELQKTIEHSFERAIDDGGAFFTTAWRGECTLFDLFLANLPEDRRQHYTCHACRKFVDTYGGLVQINDVGNLVSVFWDLLNAPEMFETAVYTLKMTVEKSKVNGVFLSSDSKWGTPVTGDWHHMSVVPPRPILYNSRLFNAGQAMAQKKQKYIILRRSLSCYKVEAVEQAVLVLESGAVDRPEKSLGIAKWFLDLHRIVNDVTNSSKKSNLIWKAAAIAPAGYAHVKNTMIGTLLDDITDGLPFEKIKRRFASKMNPLIYQRPQSLPSSGNRKQAEEIVAKMGIAQSLERRFATLEEVEIITIWKPLPAQKEEKAGGIFSHLATSDDKQQVKQVEISGGNLTWIKFLRDVLPNALKMEYKVGRGRKNYATVVTATHADAPPILQWDNEESRNPLSSYVYNHGSRANDFNISGEFVDITAVCNKPSRQVGDGVLLILNGAKDTGYKRSGIGLFPEILRSEYHSIRKTIEAYSRSVCLTGYDEASACGLQLQSGHDFDVKIRVTSALGVVTYLIDRWD